MDDENGRRGLDLKLLVVLGVGIAIITFQSKHVASLE